MSGHPLRGGGNKTRDRAQGRVADEAATPVEPEPIPRPQFPPGAQQQAQPQPAQPQPQPSSQPRTAAQMAAEAQPQPAQSQSQPQSAAQAAAGRPPPAGNPARAGGSEGSESKEPIGVDTLFSCLIRLTREFGRPVSEADVRGACSIPNDGMGINDFMRACKRLGYRAKKVPFESEELTLLPMPFVLLGDENVGAIVVLSGDENGFTVFHPVEGGQARVEANVLVSFGTGVLLVAPTGKAKGKSGWRGMVTERIKSVFWELAIASVLVNLFGLASPLFMMTVYNKVIGQQALNTLQVLAVGMVILFGFDFALRAIRGYISTHTGARLDALLGGEVVHRLVNLPYRHFETTSTGLISERLRQLETIRQFFTGQMPLVLVDLLFVFVFVGALIVIHPITAYIVMGAIPLFVLISAAFHRAQKKLVEQNFQALAAKTSTLAETVANAVTVKSLGLESEIEKRWGGKLAMSAWTGFRANNLANLINVFGTVLQRLVSLAVIFVGAHLAVSGEMSTGALIAAMLLSNQAVAPMRQVVSAWSQLQEVRAAFTRIDTIMDEAVETQAGDLLPLNQIEGEIALDNVTYTYEPGTPPAVSGVSFKVEPGTTFCIMGPSGSGKSTVAKLLQGLYEPESGRVLVDQTDIRHISPHSFRRQMGVLPQEIQLFAGTVRENIAMGAGTNDPERVMAAAKFVGAHDFIQRLPRGYDTVLAERGGGLSAGQRQLLCIARALMRNPRILIMDEPTSALDSAAEEYLLRNLRRLSGNRTIVMITHRLAPAGIADQVALMADGKVVGIGPPSEAARMMRERALPPGQTGAQNPPGQAGSQIPPGQAPASPPGQPQAAPQQGQPHPAQPQPAPQQAQPQPASQHAQPQPAQPQQAQPQQAQPQPQPAQPQPAPPQAAQPHPGAARPQQPQPHPGHAGPAQPQQAPFHPTDIQPQAPRPAQPVQQPVQQPRATQRRPAQPQPAQPVQVEEVTEPVRHGSASPAAAQPQPAEPYAAESDEPEAPSAPTVKILDPEILEPAKPGEKPTSGWSLEDL